jgi:hypothetical protein
MSIEIIERPEDLGKWEGEFAKKLHRMEGQALSRGGKDAVQLLMSATDLWPIKDRGLYKAGFRSQVQGGALTLFQVAPNVNFVDDGRRAGSKMPPLQPIREWLERRGSEARLAWVVAKTIAERGIAPRNVYAKWSQSVSALIMWSLEKAWDKAAGLTK